MIPVNKSILKEIALINAYWVTDKQESVDSSNIIYYKLSFFYTKKIYLGAEIVINSKKEFSEPKIEFFNGFVILNIKEKHGFLFTTIEKDVLFLIKESSISRIEKLDSDIILKFKKIVNV